MRGDSATGSLLALCLLEPLPVSALRFSQAQLNAQPAELSPRSDNALLDDFRFY